MENLKICYYKLKIAELKRPDNIPGYEHPNKLEYSRDSKYKTFTAGKKKKKKYGPVAVGKKYSQYTEQEIDLCFICNRE
jgi:hypothetical protein